MDNRERTKHWKRNVLLFIWLKKKLVDLTILSLLFSLWYILSRIYFIGYDKISWKSFPTVLAAAVAWGIMSNPLGRFFSEAFLKLILFRGKKILFSPKHSRLSASGPPCILNMKRDPSQKENLELLNIAACFATRNDNDAWWEHPGFETRNRNKHSSINSCPSIW